MRKAKASRACFVCVFALLACKNNPDTADAYGHFEAVETLISAECPGKLLTLSLEEGSHLEAGAVVGQVDSVPLQLQKAVLEKSIEALLAGKPDIPAQLASLEQQWAAAKREELRMQQLFQAEAATAQQVDELQSQRQILERQTHALKSSLNIQTRAILSQAETLRAQILQIDNNLAKCTLINPMAGTVLGQYAEPHEWVAVGKPIYKIADLTTMRLRAFISGSQLSQLQLGQTVTVLTDGPANTLNTYAGTLQWISDKAEFAPKMVQTREQRVNLVYAIKVSVPNDGALKIGMPAEVLFAAPPVPPPAP